MATAKLQGKARADSLCKELSTDRYRNKNDTNKAKLLDEISYAYRTIDPETGILFAKQELQLATELGWKKGIANAECRLGLNYQFKYDYSRALEHDLRALKLYAEINDKGGMAAVQMSLANVYSQMGDYAKGLEFDMSALKIFEELNDKRNIAITQGNIGNIYQVMNDYTQALVYDLSALKSFGELDDKSGIGRNLGNIGNIYLLLGEYSMALDYNFKALAIFEQLGERNGLGNINGNIGEIYLVIAKDTSGKKVSGKYIPTSKKEVLELAIDYLKKGTSICKEISTLGSEIEFGQNLAQAYKLAGNYKEALLCSKEYTAIKDSVYSQQNVQKIMHLEGERGNEVKEKELQVMQLQLVASKHANRLYIASLALLLILPVGLFVRFRTARRIKRQLEEKNKIIASEKENADMLRHRAERSERFKQQFLTNMSHEIRTPMNAVNGMTDLLLDKDPRTDQLHYLQVISRSSDILLHIIDDILDLSKIEAGKLELKSIDFSLADTIRQVKETLSFRAEEKGLLLVTHIDDKIPAALIGDPFRLNQVLINLGGNAIKFTESGSVEINVTQVHTDGQKLTLLFQIIDTGIGIPAEKLPTLFESFKQAQSSDSRIYGGTGLGLSISKQLVELQGGTISAESAEGRGTTFSFKLSYAEGSLQRLQERTKEEQKADGSMLSGLRILVVDDNEYNRMVASETLLSKVDVIIDEAVNGQEAIDLMALNDYDAVLMDVQMPVMNGLDATRYIRQQMPSPKNKTPIIALTANMLREDMAICMDAGMNTYVPKPFKAWQIISTLAEVTGRKNTKRRSVQERDETIKPIDETAPAQKPGVVDLTYLTKLCDGNETRMKKLIGVYVASVPGFIEKLNIAMATNDITEIASQVHSFKPKWMMMGMKQSSELGLKIEKQIKEQTEGELHENISLLLAEAERSVTELANRN